MRSRQEDEQQAGGRSGRRRSRQEEEEQLGGRGAVRWFSRQD